jgi:hypothetical protein
MLVPYWKNQRHFLALSDKIVVQEPDVIGWYGDTEGNDYETPVQCNKQDYQLRPRFFPDDVNLDDERFSPSQLD